MIAQAGFVEARIHGWTGYRTSPYTEGASVSARKSSMDGANGNAGFGWMLVIAGLVIAGIGLIWILAAHLPRLGRLPGDIVIEQGNSRFYFPVVTCILISIVLRAYAPEFSGIWANTLNK